MTPPTQQESWREEFKKARQKQFNSGNPYWPDWEAVEDFIGQVEQSAYQRVIDEISKYKEFNETYDSAVVMERELTSKFLSDQKL